MEIIVSHVNADFDALAAMVAAQKIYPKATLAFVGSQNKNVRDFILLHQDILDFVDIKHLDKKKITRLIVVDTKIASRLGEMEDVVYQKGAKIVAFDHHPPTKEDMKLNQDFSEILGATTTTLVRIIRSKRAKLSSFEATLFALGIYEDTGSLTYPTTTPADSEMVAFLMSNKANLKVINQFLNQPLNSQQRSLLKQLLKVAKLVEIDGVNVFISQATVKSYVDGAAVLAHKIEELEKPDVVFVLLKLANRIHIIARSRVEEIDVGDILSVFNGGGHPQAASAITRTTPAKKLAKTLLEEVHFQLKKPLVAREAMVKPALITPKTPVKEAKRKMQRLKLSSLLVCEGEKIAGWVSKKDVEKAYLHKLSHAPVKGITTAQPIEVLPTTPLNEIEKYLSENGVGQVPVVEKGKLLGVINRAELLKSLYGRDYLADFDFAAQKTKFSRSDMVERIKTLLPQSIQVLLRELGRIGERQKLSTYLVGGIVRDLLLDTRNLDIDIVVEGDGIGYGKKVSEVLGGRVVSHKKFTTAVVVLPNRFHIDIASARVEKYPKPAALPEVKLSSIEQDLYRRDFSINAMAISLNPGYFGRLFDFFDGQVDLENKRVKVLHKRSFVDDPTRIFRAVRFEERFGFTMDKETEKLAHQAVERKLLKELTNARVRDELILILSEDNAWDALKRLAELGVLKRLHSQIEINATLRNSFKQITDSIPQLEVYLSKKFHRDLLFLMAILSKFEKKDLVNWLNRMKLKRADVEQITEGIFVGSEVLKILNSSSKVTNSRLYHLLSKLSYETLVFIYSQGSRLAKRRIIFYLANLKDTTLHLNGKELLKLGAKPSPAVGAILKDLFDAKLNGEVKTKTQEIKIAKEEIRLLKRNEKTS